MGEAAKISLKAIGKQDTYLLSNDPEESFFKDRSERHSEFRKYHRTRTITNTGSVPNWPFGQTIKVEFKPQNMGDLLSNMWLTLTMPGITDGRNYADQLGRHILKSATMYVDDIEVEKIHDDWGIIYDELYLEMSEKIANRFLVNRNLPFDSSVENIEFAQFESDIVVPIHFFFSRKYASDEYASNIPNRPYFPTCAIHKQKIEFELEFHDIKFFTNTFNPIPLPSFQVVTEELTISPDERLYLMNERQQLVTDVVRKHPTTESELNKDTIRTNLVPSIPVKCIHWFLRNVKFENETLAIGDSSIEEEMLFQNRFNFSLATNFNQVETFFTHIMESARFFINGTLFPNVTDTNNRYYKHLVPSRNRLSRPIRNIYTYSFSMNPINVEPSGNLDFSQIESEKTVIEVKIGATSSNIYNLHMYYTGYQTFAFDQGFMRVAY